MPDRQIDIELVAADDWRRQHCTGCGAAPGDHRLSFDGMYLSLCTPCAGYLRGLLPEPTVQRPPFPADGICPTCSHDSDWVVVESGYMRWTRAEMMPYDSDVPQPPVLTGFPNGCSDYSDDGDDQWVECTGEQCEGLYEAPENLEFS